MSKILERLKIAQQTGEWWKIPWWRREDYYNDGPYTREQAETAFSELISIFDAEWMLNQMPSSPNMHYIASSLLQEGHSPFQYLCSLGLNLYKIRKAELIEDIERRLKNPNEYGESAEFELSWLRIMLDDNFQIVRHYPSGKGRNNCDFHISKGDSNYYVEIKRPTEYSQLNSKHISDALCKTSDQIKDDSFEGMEPIPMSLKSESDKVFRLLRYAVKNQLPRHGIGFVIIESPHYLDWDDFEKAAIRRFGKRQHYYAPLHAVILTKGFFDSSNLRINFKHRVIHNPASPLENENETLPFPLPKDNRAREA